MSSIADFQMITHHPDTKEYVRKAYDLHKPGRMEESIDRLQEWIKAQPHFNKKDFERGYLEITIINNKGLIEKAKQKLEKQFAIKTFGPKFFSTDVRPIDLDDLANLYTAPLPRLTKDHHRIYFLRNVMDYYGPNVTKNYCTHSVFLLEYMARYNYSMGMVLIFDWRKADLVKLISCMTFDDARYCFDIFLKGYQMRIYQLHIITSSKLIETLLATAKPFVSPKVLSRVMIHKKIDSLYKYVDRDLLPSDYGGKEKPLIDLADDWNKFLSSDKYMAYCREMFKATIDTSKKPKAEFNDLFMGMAGTFRTLQLD